MLGVILFLIAIAFCLVLYRKRMAAYMMQKWRFIRMISALPGPSIFSIMAEVCKFSLDSEKFTYQAEALFRRYAYENEHGILRLWLGTYPLIFLTRAKSAKVILESTTLINKPEDYDIFKRLVGSGMLSSSGETWFKARRILTPAFHFNILNKYVEVFNEQSKILLEKLDRHSDTNETFDILPYLRLYGLDVVAETAMGVSIGAQNGKNAEYYISLKKLLNLMWAKIRYPWFWFAPIRWLYGYDAKLDYHCNVCKSLTRKIIAQKKKEWEAFDHQPSMEELSASGKRKLAFLDLLMSVRDENKLTDEDIRSQVDMFMAAGEVDRDITVEDMTNMKYLYQCICETGRITPNVVFLGRKITEDIEVCGYTIPAGATCVISPFAVMRDPQHYDNPEIYDPEHFSAENVTKRDPFAFIPFSAGIRNCIGHRFAILEMKVTLASILRKYRIISMLPEEENRPIPEFSLKPSKGFPVRLERR
uniref:Cytochrome P450 n=1 Tax=Ascaris lumbricoides TaxID=6252 RepID=A0A9J2Q8G0_ASCLU